MEDRLTIKEEKISDKPKQKLFTGYQVFVIILLSALQFTIILDFMVLSPLGAILMPKLHISTSQFGSAVSAYAFSAGISGLLTAGFADKFDRKKLMLFFYSGFLVGTFLCGIAETYVFLLFARIVTGIFGGVIGSIGFAIITDLFKMEVRGRVMGFVQTAFAASQVLGLPIGLILANHWNWHAPFIMIVCFGALMGIIMFMYLKPVDQHLHFKRADHNALKHLTNIFAKSFYVKAFMATALLATGGFMLMPFGSAFGINNLGLKMGQLPILYACTGFASIIFGPLAGKLSDKLGKYKIFWIGSIISIVMVLYYTQLGFTPLWVVICINIILFAGITARMISASALMTAVPAAQDRGAFMSVNASVQQIAGGIAAMIAGLIVVQTPKGHIEHYPALGYVVCAAMVVPIILLFYINRQVAHKLHKPEEKI